MDIERAIAFLRWEHLMISKAIQRLEYVLIDPSIKPKRDRRSLVAEAARTGSGVSNRSRRRLRIYPPG
jgi:hypothetical protein